MPITGLLLTLSHEPQLQQQALAHLQARPELQLGPLVERWLPVAFDAADDARCRELHDSLQSLAGVEQVDVVYVNFEEVHAADAGGARIPRLAEPLNCN